MTPRAIRTILLYPWLIAASGCSPSSTLIPERPTCRECTILVEKIAQIGDTSQAHSLAGRPLEVQQSSAGTFFINVLDAFPMVFDPNTGSLTSFGRPGGGPGEYRRPRIRAVLPDDSLLVSDAFTYHVLGPGGDVARSLIAPHDLPRLVVLQWPTQVVATRQRHDPATDNVMSIVATYDMSGDSVQVQDTLFHSAPISGLDEKWVSVIRILGEPSSDGSLWVSDYNAYRLVRFHQGIAVDSITRQPKWFPGGEKVARGSPTEPATPHMQGAWVDSEGLLWVIVSQPRSDFKKAWEGMPSMEGAREMRVAALPADYELKRTVIEVIDPAARRVLARHTFDGYVIDIMSDQRVASFVETDYGVPILHIHRLSLQRGES